MNYSLNVKSSSIVHTLLSNCVKLLGKVQKLLIKCISYSVISKRICVVSPKFYTARKNFTGPPVPPVPTNFKFLGPIPFHVHFFARVGTDINAEDANLLDSRISVHKLTRTLNLFAVS